MTTRPAPYLAIAGNKRAAARRREAAARRLRLEAAELERLAVERKDRDIEKANTIANAPVQASAIVADAHPADETAMTDNTPPPPVSVVVAAELLGVSRWTIYRMVERGDLHAVRVGALQKIRRAEIDRYLYEPTS